MPTPAQIPLPLAQPEGPRLADFLPGPNTAAFDRVRRAAAGDEGIVYLWGPTASGKSHLLMGACAEAVAAGRRAAYLDPGTPESASPALLEGLETCDLVAVDRLEAAAGTKVWEARLLLLADALHGRGALLVASRPPPAALPLALPDLRTRLAWGGIYALSPLGERECAAVLERRAQARGLHLPPEVTTYLLARCERRLDVLLAVLERLDEASLATSRRITIPFVRRVLGL